jgi:hypothetical protein
MFVSQCCMLKRSESDIIPNMYPLCSSKVQDDATGSVIAQNSPPTYMKDCAYGTQIHGFRVKSRNPVEQKRL